MKVLGPVLTWTGSGGGNGYPRDQMCGSFEVLVVFWLPEELGGGASSATLKTAPGTKGMGVFSVSRSMLGRYFASL